MNAPPGTNLLAQQLRFRALELEATRFQRLARDAPIGIVFIASDGVLELANDEFLRITGRSRAEFEADRFGPARSELPAWLDPSRGPRFEADCVRSDGSRVPVLVGISRQQDGLAAFIIDLSAEKEAQRAREQSEERCRSIAQQLQEADKRKDEFLSVLSHELRNPLAPIRNALHLLSRARDDPARAARAQDVIERQIEHLSRLVDDLLDVTRITRGRVHLHRAPTDLRTVVGHTIEDHRPGFDAADVKLTVEIPPAPVPVEGDPTRLAQVLGNLLTNAVKFTPRGGTVAVHLEQAGDGSAILRVRDTGEGIDPAILPTIFEPFSQADRTLARTRGGLGLGLAVVKGLVELHGGTVAASSGGRGAGSEFTVRLPSVAVLASPPLPRPPPARAARVLVVEDNVDAAETLREALDLEGMEVAVAGDGAEGLDAAQRMRPDVVICDIGLPGTLSGYDVARALRADPVLRDVPLIALTGYAGPEDRARAREAGFDRHLGKPCAVNDVLRAVASVVRV